MRLNDQLTVRAKQWMNGLGELLMPSACAVCRAPHRSTFATTSAATFAATFAASNAPRSREDRAGDIVCANCINRLEAFVHPLCARCGHPRMSAHSPLPSGASDTGAPDALPPCRWCVRLPPYVRAVRSVSRMDRGSGSGIVHALKYGGWSRVAVPMARSMSRADFPRDVVSERTALVPVPLAATRLRERGYNQAERLAAALAPHWKIPVWNDVVMRTRHTRSQVQLTPSERTGNVSRAFTVDPSTTARLRGTHLVLVDDVITTAATLNAVAQALTEGGTRIISYITFGRAPEPGDRTDSDFASDQD